jgi:hypothetical protein
MLPKGLFRVIQFLGKKEWLCGIGCIQIYRCISVYLKCAIFSNLLFGYMKHPCVGVLVYMILYTGLFTLLDISLMFCGRKKMIFYEYDLSCLLLSCLIVA